MKFSYHGRIFYSSGCGLDKCAVGYEALLRSRQRQDGVCVVFHFQCQLHEVEKLLAVCTQRLLFLRLDGLLFIHEVCGRGFGYVKQMCWDVGCFLSFRPNTMQGKTNTFSLGRDLRGSQSTARLSYWDLQRIAASWERTLGILSSVFLVVSFTIRLALEPSTWVYANQ